MNKCSNRNNEVKVSALLGNYDRPTDQPTGYLVLSEDLHQKKEVRDGQNEGGGKICK